MKTKIRKTYNFLIRLLIIVATYGFIYNEVFYGHDFDKIFSEFQGTFSKPETIIMLALCVLLVLVNWGVETGKWQYLIRKIEKVNFFRAFKAVLAGVAISSFTPNRIGEFLGRVFILEKANRVEGILITILGSISQFLVTFILGASGIAIFVLVFKGLITEELGISGQLFTWLYLALALITLALFAFLLMLFLKVSVVKDFVNRLAGNRWKKIKKYTRVFNLYQPGELAKVLGYSLLRYFIYTLQFYLMLRVFGVNLPLIPGLVMISIILFAITIIPTIAIAELGIRGSLAIFIIGTYLNSHGLSDLNLDMGIIAASSGIWLINLAIPALIGAIMVFNLKFFRKNG
jgi:uncharacterized membrane protein YbhN (UPF0104 family)